MPERIIALDIGGSAVKAGLFEDDSMAKRCSWQHDYLDCDIISARDSLIKEAKAFYGGRLDAIGIGAAGLIATDNTLYCSTVISSFAGFNLGRFMQESYGASAYSIDNDADCGAIGEWLHRKEAFFYVVVGSGIGSQYIEGSGDLKYRIRVDQDKAFCPADNPLPNDLGLRLVVDRSYAAEKIAQAMTAPDKTDQDISELIEIVAGSSDSAAIGIEGETQSVRVGLLGSAAGVRNIYNIMRMAEGRAQMLTDQDSAEQISRQASEGDSNSVLAYRLFGHFLGYGISRAAEQVAEEQGLKSHLKVVLAGPIMGSYDLFADALLEAVAEGKARCDILRADDTANNNLLGAYHQACFALKGRDRA